MSALDKISKEDLKELLNKNWMTHDAMWFYHSFNEMGIEVTNKLNRRAVRSMAAVEVKRIKKLLGNEKLETFEDIKKFIIDVIDLTMPKFMEFKISFSEENIFRGEWGKCFAYEGIKKIGAIEEYQCGIFERVEGWLDALGIRFSVKPEVKKCMMHTDGNCYREYEISV